MKFFRFNKKKYEKPIEIVIGDRLRNRLKIADSYLEQKRYIAALYILKNILPELETRAEEETC